MAYRRLRTADASDKWGFRMLELDDSMVCGEEPGHVLANNYMLSM